MGVFEHTNYRGKGLIIMTAIHGGDIYRNRVEIDFSVNVNPLGIPETVKKAMRKAVEVCGQYPDINNDRLKQEVSRMKNVPEEYLLFGNGASELFMAIVHAVRPEKTVIPVPSFYGYEYAVNCQDGEIVYWETGRENGFRLTEEIYGVLTESVDLLFLANPNNPTGGRMDRGMVRGLLRYCRDKGIYVVMDECFIEFCGGGYSAAADVGRFDNLILVKAFTKIFSVPGVRLGYLLCRNRELRERIKRQLPEWNVSCFAQAAGCACALETEFEAATAGYVRRERQFLEKGLGEIGCQVFPSETNFILFYSEAPVYGELLNRGILVRNCANFRGLGPGFYRVAVKTRKENEILLREIERVMAG